MSKLANAGAPESLLAEFGAQSDLYGRLTRAIESLLVQLLHEKGLRVHSVTSRLKDRASLEKKISRKLGKYTRLSDITDLCGIRIITHYPDEVDAVAGVIESEFVVDRGNSIDKRAALDPDRFGYLSLHYVCSLSPSRSALTEYRLFKDLVVEIQIRSIVQHAWAEIQHDLGYKSKVAVPKEAQRRFFQLAATLELVDSQFADLRTQIHEYEQLVESRVVTNSVADIAIDANSISAYVANNDTVTETDAFIAKAGKSTLDAEFDSEYAAARVSELSFIGITHLSELDSKLKAHAKDIRKFAELHWAGRPLRESFPRGISIFYLSYALAAEKGQKFLFDYIKHFNIGPSEGHQPFAEQIMSTFSKIRNV